MQPEAASPATTTMGADHLRCQFETDEADLDNVADAGLEGVAGGLVVQVGAVGAAGVLHVPGVVAIPQARMLARDERFGQEDVAGGAASDGILRRQVETGTRFYLLAGAAIYHD